MPYEQMTLILLLLGIIAARGDNNKNDCTGIKEDFPHLKQCEQKCTPSKMSCVEVNGRWKCLVNTCPPLSDPENGEVIVADLEAGIGAAFYSCQAGFELAGASLRTCDDDGAWTDAEPECTQIECVPPEEPDNGHIEISGTVYGSEVRYTCDYGYSLSGPEFRLCCGNGQWSGTDPVCVKVCGGELFDMEGNFTSPYYQAVCSLGYPENFTCIWTIRAPTDSVVYVKFGRYDLGYYGDKVYLYDGPDTESTLLRT